LKQEWAALQTRRHFLGRTGKVLGWAAMASLLGDRALRGDALQQAVKVRMRFQRIVEAAALRAQGQAGNLSVHVRRPAADRSARLQAKPGALYDKDIPDSVRGGQQLTGMTAGQARFPIAPSHWAFKRYGQTGTWVSDLLPNTARMVDDLTIIKSTNTDAINHEPAIMLMNTGNMNAGKPCLGAWLSYGLGSMNDNLPTFMVLQSKLNMKENNQPVSSRLWSSGFLSSEYAAWDCAPSGRSGALSQRPQAA
jgi:hypothetical protein